VTKTVSFKQATEWPFDDVVITSSTAWYRGAQLSGNIANEQAKGHLVGKEGATFRLPMNPNEKAVVTFYYSANFSIDGGDAVTATTSKGSTSKTESVEYRYAGTEPGYATITFGSGSTYLTHIAVKPVVAYAATLRVGPQETYTTINDALEAVRCMERNATDRVEILIAPGNYEEMLVIDVPNVSLTNASATPSLALKNKGVDIDAEAVRITSYYGHGYHYYSMNNQKWDAEVLRVNKENGYRSYDNVGGGTTNASYWNATVVITAEGFEAHNIIFENSYNQYISAKEADDVVEEWATGGKGTRPTTAGSTAVQAKSYVERAAAVAIANNTDRTVFDNCRIIGRQDSFFGGINSRMAFYKGCVMGAVDYIFGGMVAAFYQTELQFNTSDDKNDTGYITAAQQTSGRGYLMYECSVTSTKPGVETASSYESKPGCFGRPWAAQTAEVVFYNTKVNATSHPDYKGKSLISAAGWSSSLSGESALCGEYGTTELSGEDNSSKRASWAQQFTAPQLADGTEITLYNFTKGTDGWDPFAALIDRDGTSIGSVNGADAAQVRLTVDGSTLRLAGLGSAATVSVYTAEGALRAQAQATDTYDVVLPAGIYVVRAQTAEGVAVMKAAVR
jgi:pectin methylesterase-like acyl-CoA thioesterase